MKKKNYLGRQPVLDRERKIIGYQLFYRAHSQDQAKAENDLSASAQVLANLLGNLDSDWLPPGKLVFLHVDASLVLDEDFLALLPPGRMVLDVDCTLLPFPPQLLAACGSLRERKIGLSLDNCELTESTAPLVKLADFVKLDVSRCDATALFEMLGHLEGLSARPIAKNVETGRDFKFCHDAGFDCFQGYYFARPEIVTAKAINPGQMNLVELLNLVGDNAEAKRIEAVFKRDPVLLMKLLAYINSAAMGLSRQVTSIPQALALIGYRQLYRWVALLLYTAGDSLIPPALEMTVLTRSRLIELLGKPKLPRQEQDNLFIVGMLSMLGVILAMPLEKVLEKLHIPEAISLALLERSGVYGPFLALAEACENCDMLRMSAFADELGMHAEDVNSAHLAAISWAESLGAGQAA